MNNSVANDKRRVVVTGASSGIGYELALNLRQYGYRVIATARTDEQLEKLRSLGLTCVQLELEKHGSVAAAVDEIVRLCHGQLFALVNNAAYGQPGAVEDLERAVLEKQFAVNLFGTHQLTRALLPQLRAGDGGRIINISSILGLVAFPWQGAYNASKFALEGLSDTMRLELRGSNVHISLIEPGPIRSRFRSNALRAFHSDIDWQQSHHVDSYRRVSGYYAANSHPTPFTGAPQHVCKRVRHALCSPRPKAHYYVTLPSYFLATCRRLLPYSLMDRLLSKLGSMR